MFLKFKLEFHKIHGKAPMPGSLLKKETPTQLFSCEHRQIFKNTFLKSDCFSKYENFYMLAAEGCLIKSCSENVWKISGSTYASDLQVT